MRDDTTDTHKIGTLIVLGDEEGKEHKDDGGGRSQEGVADDCGGRDKV